ncbi:MAG: hypothetical protein HYY61_04620, partial [Deltaproteobacteria bacterium]|nr:hypothetical protein [Deltaproteobacteria bacterium]
MTTQKKLAFLFVAVPFILPFFVTIAYSSFKFVKLDIKPLSIQNEYSLDQIAKATIQVVKVEEAPFVDISPEEWLFDIKLKREKKTIVVAASPVFSPKAPPPIILEKISKEEDPFLNE